MMMQFKNIKASESGPQSPRWVKWCRKIYGPIASLIIVLVTYFPVPPSIIAIILMAIWTLSAFIMLGVVYLIRKKSGRGSILNIRGIVSYKTRRMLHYEQAQAYALSIALLVTGWYVTWVVFTIPLAISTFVYIKISKNLLSTKD